MASIGQELKRERELRGIPLQEIADSTKINIRFLRALEEDQLDILPEKFFTRGIIRTYAKYLGLDEESVLNLYLESLQRQQEPKPSREDEIKKNETSETPSTDKNRFWLFFWIFLVIAALFITITFVLKKEKTPPSEAQIPSAAQIIQEDTVQSIPLESPAEITAIQEGNEEPLDGLDLEIRVEQETWMEIYADQELQFSGIKPPGAALQFRAVQEFLIHLGNAGGITFTINGRKGKKLGESGAVEKDIRITLDNYKDFWDKEEQ